jgi:hypothetical protein
VIQWSTLLGVCLSGTLPACGQALPQSQEARTRWTAEWISHPSAPLREPAVFHFRKEINLATQPRHFIVKVSADNRFVLYVNGIRIGDGPARGDLLHWRYETFDLALALHAGQNSIGATVWNFGIYAPLAQISNRTAFLMQGDTEAESSVDTDGSWQVETEPGFTFIPRKANGFWFYWAADPGEHLDGHRYDWDWRSDRTSSTSHWLSTDFAAKPTRCNSRQSVDANPGHTAADGIRGCARRRSSSHKPACGERISRDSG